MLARGIFGFSTDILRARPHEEADHVMSSNSKLCVDVSIDLELPSRGGHATNSAGGFYPNKNAMHTTNVASTTHVKRYMLRRGPPGSAPLDDPPRSTPSPNSNNNANNSSSNSLLVLNHDGTAGINSGNGSGRRATPVGKLPSLYTPTLDDLSYFGRTFQDDIQLQRTPSPPSPLRSSSALYGQLTNSPINMSISMNYRSRGNSPQGSSPRSISPPTSEASMSEDILPSTLLQMPLAIRLSPVFQESNPVSKYHTSFALPERSRSASMTHNNNNNNNNNNNSPLLVHRYGTPTLDVFADAAMLSPPSGVRSFDSSEASSRVPSPILLPPPASTKISKPRDSGSSVVETLPKPQAMRTTPAVAEVSLNNEWVIVTDLDILASAERQQRSLQNAVMRWTIVAQSLVAAHEQFCTDLEELVEGYVKPAKLSKLVDDEEELSLFGSVGTVFEHALNVRRVFREAKVRDSNVSIDTTVKSVLLMANALQVHVRSLPHAMQHLQDKRSWDEAFEEFVLTQSKTQRSLMTLVKRPMDYVELFIALIKSFADVLNDQVQRTALLAAADNLHLWTPRSDEQLAMIF